LTTLWVVIICGATAILDNYDLVVFGTTVPSLQTHWAISGATVGMIASVTLIGMMLGAILVGSITDRVGRRRVVISAVTLFSVLMPVSALATSPELFAVLRFLTGVGLGGVMPAASALVAEYAPPGRRNLTFVISQAGYPLGGVLAAALSIWIIPAYGWQWMYVIGGLPLITIVPLAIRFLPESLEYLAASGQDVRAAELAARTGRAVPSTQGKRHLSAAGIFQGGYAVPTVVFWFLSFCGLALIYGFNTWLPAIMRSAGYPLGSALSFLLAFNVGAVMGSLIGGYASDRWNPQASIAVSFAAGALAAIGMTITSDAVFLYILLAVSGYGAVGTIALINSFVAQAYPSTLRARGIGWALAVGRLGAVLGPMIGGLIADAELGFAANFYAFSFIGLLGALAALVLLRPTYRAVTSASPTRRATGSTSAAVPTVEGN
jgi:AAHS family benzoate transporter-like MFS transporter